jgi:hypothetical protein
VDFTLKFNKTDSGGIFLNSYNAKLTTKKNEISHNFPVNRENTLQQKKPLIFRRQKCKNRISQSEKRPARNRFCKVQL